MDVQKFTGAVVSVIVVVIIAVTVLIPIIADNQLNTDSTQGTVVANAASLNAMINIIPLLVIVGIIIAVVGMFLYTRKKQ